MLLGTGCSSSERVKEDVSTESSELKLSGVKYLGKIATGETKTTPYFNPPRYRAYGFDAYPGDEVTVEVTSTYGDAMTWLTDTGYESFAYNDDASDETLNSKIVYKIPTSAAPAAYRIVFRDYDTLDATFKVSLTIRPGSLCQYGGEVYHGGETFTATDGCNTCACGPSGIVSCTKRVCACNPANEPWRNYLGTPETCLTLRYTCNPGWHTFSNACGCGCEKN